MTNGASNSLRSPATKLVRKRLEKYAPGIPKLLVSDSPDNIHQVRVASRRLQQALSMLFPKPRTSKSRDLIRSLRKVRRDLSGCRNFDVISSLLQNNVERTGGGALQDAWQDVREHALKLREKEFARARKRLRRIDVVDFIEKAQRLINGIEREKPPEFGRCVDLSAAKWQESFTKAAIDQSRDSLHALRLAGKQLRYRLEIMAELKSADASSYIPALKALQDSLGQWHDRYVLVQFTEKFIGKRADRNGNEEYYAALQAALDAYKRDNQAAVESILKQAESVGVTVTTAGDRGELSFYGLT